MDSSLYYFKVLAAFVFVIALMYLIGFAAKRWGGQAVAGAAKNAKIFSKTSGCLRIVDTTMLDYRRRLVLVEYNQKGYMIMLGPQSESLVAAGITLNKKDLEKQEPEAHEKA